MAKLLADQLRELWRDVEHKKLTAEEFQHQNDAWLAEFSDRWKKALALPAKSDFTGSMLGELTDYLRLGSLDELKAWHERAATKSENTWRDSVDPHDRKSVDRFYDECELELYSLLFWHTLTEDN